VFDPDRPAGGACAHLAFACAWLDAARAAWGGTWAGAPGRSGAWLWAWGEGLRRPRGGPVERDDLTDYVLDWACGTLPEERLPAGADYRGTGAGSLARDEARPGSGEFPLAGQGGPPLVALLDGWGVFAADPAALAAEARRRAGS
jgi:hypothetical protein